MNTEIDELNEFDEARLLRAFKSEFASAAYGGAAPKKSHRTPIFIAAAAAIAAAVIGVNVLGTAAQSGAWAATPRAVSADQQAAAVSACQALADRVAKVRVPNMSVVAFDARGTSTFVELSGIVTGDAATAEVAAGSQQTMSCMTVPGPDGTPQLSGSGSLSPTASALGDQAMGIGYPGGSAFVAWGPVAPGAVSVELRAPGLDTATATISDGHYAVWWPKSVDGTIVEVGNDGSIIKSIPLNVAPPSKP